MTTTARPRSFVVGSDAQVLRMLLALHATPDPRILDVTYGLGTMWKGTGYEHLVYGCDLDPTKWTHRRADFRDLSWSDPQNWNVVVFDPPHMTEAGATSRMHDRYGLGGIGGASIASLFPEFLGQVGRVLAPGGVVLVKVADQVHRNAHQWQLVDLIIAVRAAGLTACDLVVKADPAAGKLQGLWKRVLHTRNSHCYWVVVRKGSCSPVRPAA
jgi:SAM-dependent methyltransferase